MPKPKAAVPSAAVRSSATAWTFLTNYAHVLLCIAQDPTSRMRDVAMKVGITERAVQHIVAELEAAGYLSRTRDGRNNRYTMHTELTLRHPVERHCPISTLIEMTLRGGNGETRKSIPGARRPVRGS